MQPVRVVLAAHQADTPGGFGFNFAPSFLNVPNLEYNASGFAPVPEPEHWALALGVPMAAWAVLRRRTSAR